MAKEDSILNDISNVTRREMKRLLNNRVYFWLVIVLPLASFTFFITFFLHGKPTDLPVAVYDADNSALSRQVTRMLDATQSIAITQHVTDLEEGKKLLDNRKVYGLVAFQDGLEGDVYQGLAPTVQAWYNNAFIVPGGLINKDITTVIRTASAGIALSTAQKRGESQEQAMATIMPIKVDTRVLFNPYTNYFYYLVSCFLPVMLQIFILTTGIYSIGTELKYGTAANWLATGNNRITRSLFGKMLPSSVVFLCMAFLMVMLQYRYFGMPMAGNFYMILLSAFLLVMTYQALAIALIAIFPNLRMALSMGSSYAAMAFTFSGLTFPYKAMPEGAQIIGNIFPFSHYLKIIIDQAFRGAPLQTELMPLLAMGVFLLLPWLALRRMKQVSLDSRFWGKI